MFVAGKLIIMQNVGESVFLDGQCVLNEKAVMATIIKHCNILIQNLGQKSSGLDINLLSDKIFVTLDEESLLVHDYQVPRARLLFAAQRHVAAILPFHPPRKLVQ